MILAVALVTVAAAAAGPAYYAASRSSILHDNLSAAPELGRGFEVTQFGAVDTTLRQLQSELSSDASNIAHWFEPPIDSINATVVDPRTASSTTLAWRTGICAHIRIEGACPAAPNQIIVSRSFSSTTGLRTGQTIRIAGWSPLTVVGVYSVPAASGDYWFDHASTYFPYEYPPTGPSKSASATEDALFTSEATMQAAAVSTQGQAQVDSLLDVHRVRPGDESTLSARMSSLEASTALAVNEAVVITTIPGTMASAEAGSSALAVPVLLITLQLLGLAWLLLFLLVTEAVAARGPEVALAKLRGHGGLRTAIFGLSEPATLVLISFPLGALLGWAIASGLATSLLRSGTPVGLPLLAWGAAAAATLGGLAAVVLASWRTLRRPVVEQWRRASTSGSGRTWVVDSILLTGAVAGLIELYLSGKVSSAHRGTLSLLVPGLLGLAVAVVASRLLPILCRSAMGGNRRSSLGSYLALRYVARRPGGSRTTIMLASAVALAVFALCGWALDQANYRTVARSTVGAPTVLTVTIPENADLGRLVASADPTGTEAAAVQEYTSNDQVTVAVDPQTWRHVVSWTTAAGRPGGPALVQAAASLAPPEPPPLILEGDMVELSVNTRALSPSGSALSLDVVAVGATAPTPVQLGSVPANGSVNLYGSLVGCPCIVQDLTVVQPQGVGEPPLSGTVTLQRIDIHTPGGWKPIDARFDKAAGWESADQQPAPDKLVLTPIGLSWSFAFQEDVSATLECVDRPGRLPVIASSQLTGKGPYTAVGLDGSDMPVQVVSTVPAVPGAPADGILVDRQFADLASTGDLATVENQVWLAHDAPTDIVKKLEGEGVSVSGVQTETGYAKTLNRQGPGLAGDLFLVEAGVAAVLAAGAAVLGLYLSARRRRYELAALLATGVSRRTLLSAISGEQLIVILFGVIVGTVTGVVAALTALRDVPEFLNQPAAPPLATFPSLGPLLLIVGAGAVAVLLVSFVAGLVLARSVRLEQLREGPS
jgi:putative ABC transport system permease protein